MALSSIVKQIGLVWLDARQHLIQELHCLLELPSLDEAHRLVQLHLYLLPFRQERKFVTELADLGKLEETLTVARQFVEALSL